MARLTAWSNRLGPRRLAWPTSVLSSILARSSVVSLVMRRAKMSRWSPPMVPEEAASARP